MKECLENYFDSFSYANIIIAEDTLKGIQYDEVCFLNSLGVTLYSCIIPKQGWNGLKASNFSNVYHFDF